MLLMHLKQLIAFRAFKAHPFERWGRKATGLTPAMGTIAGLPIQFAPSEWRALRCIARFAQRLAAVPCIHTVF